MRLKTLLIWGAVLFVAADLPVSGNGLTPSPEIHPPLKHRLKIPVIVLDPGHGGDDFGATGVNGVKEKDVTLDIARKTREYLEYLGYTVVMTRTDDRFIPLEERGRICKQAHGDLFVSIHANSAANKDASGFETFFLNPHRDSSGIKKYGFFTYFSLSATGKKSLNLAKIIQKEMVERTGSFDRGVKMAKFRVLRDSTVPGVLVETGFLSNRAEAAALGRHDYRGKVALALAKSVQRFKTR